MYSYFAYSSSKIEFLNNPPPLYNKLPIHIEIRKYAIPEFIPLAFASLFQSQDCNLLWIIYVPNL